MDHNRRQKPERGISNRAYHRRNALLPEIAPHENKKLAEVPQNPQDSRRQKQKIRRGIFLRPAVAHDHHEQQSVERHAERETQQIYQQCRIQRVHLRK
jgi:hypothetical protein